MTEDKLNDVNDIIYWITLEVIKKGSEQYNNFIINKNKCESCKPYITENNMNYEDCMIQKWNYLYEKHLDDYKNDRNI